AVAAERPFATRVLGLGKGAAHDHRRELGAGFVTALRVDAWRVLVGAAAGEGQRAMRERWRETAERVLGGGVPAELCGVLPAVRPGDGAALCGVVLATPARRQLIERFDEDWFRNPRAIAELRHEDTLARDVTPITS